MYIKYLIFLGVLIGLYVFGSIVGPAITPILVDKPKVSSVLQHEVKMGDANVIFSVDLTEVSDAELPPELKLLKSLSLPLIAGSGTKELVSGTMVNFINREGEMLIIQSKDQLAKGRVSIDSTDIFEAILMRCLTPIAGDAETQIMAKNSVAPVAPVASAAPVAPAAPAPAVAPADIPEEIQEEEVVQEAPNPEVEPEIASSLSPEKIVEAMQLSIRAGEIKEFTFDQVKSWEAGSDERIDGTKFQTGIVTYETETIFGMKEIKAKALIHQAEIMKWLFVNTGMQIQ